MGLQLQTILNAEDSPSRNGAPDTPTSARYPSGVPSVQQPVSIPFPHGRAALTRITAQCPALA